MKAKNTMNDLKITVSGRETSCVEYDARFESGKGVIDDMDGELPFGIPLDTIPGCGCRRKLRGEITVMAREIRPLVPPEGEDEEIEEDDYYYDSEDNAPVAPFREAAKIKITAYDLAEYDCFVSDFLLDSHPDVGELHAVADECDGEEEGYIAAFEKLVPKIFEQLETEAKKKHTDVDSLYGWMFDGGWLITLERFYIMPEFRRMGLSRFLRDNLRFFISNIFHIDPTWLVAYIRPDEDKGVDVDQIREVVRNEYRNKPYAVLDSNSNYCASLLLTKEQKETFFKKAKNSKRL